MPRLRRADCSGPGFRRVRRGKGFSYLDEDGDPIDEPEVVERIRELGIPPAWERGLDLPLEQRPHPGHRHATRRAASSTSTTRNGAAGATRRSSTRCWTSPRRCRRCASTWRPTSRGGDALTRERVLACAVRLLDRGFFRIGTEEYTVTNESFGLATMRKEHVTARGGRRDGLRLPRQERQAPRPGDRRPAGDRRGRASSSAAAAGARSCSPSSEGRRWHDLRSGDINEYLKEVTGADYSAKDFRTWNATVLAATALAVSGEVAGSKTGRKRAISRAVKEVAYYLGNTPAVCRASYIDPRVFDAYEGGLIISPVLEEAAGGAGRRAPDPPARGRGGGHRPDRRAHLVARAREDRRLTHRRRYASPCDGRLGCRRERIRPPLSRGQGRRARASRRRARACGRRPRARGRPAGARGGRARGLGRPSARRLASRASRTARAAGATPRSASRRRCAGRWPPATAPAPTRADRSDDPEATPG